MFGIKTKKDKRIEQLENMVNTLYFKRACITESINAKTLIAAGTIMKYPEHRNVPIEWYKQQIRSKLAEQLDDFIQYDIEDDKSTGNKILKGYLVVGK